MSYEVSEPILNSPFEKPAEYWYIQEGEEPQRRPGRRPPVVFPPRDQKEEWTETALLRRSKEYPAGYELALVSLIRERVEAWRREALSGAGGVTRTTCELLQWWRRDGREKRLFYAQLEAAETVIFLNEARADFLQGISVPRDEPSDDRKAEGYAGFLRYACKMATGAGKTTVMGMLAAWSILNKVNDRSDGRFSDVVLVVCPNVTIRGRLNELDPKRGEASIYRTRDLVPAHLMPLLTQGRVLVTNWHVFAPQGVQAGGVTAKVNRSGVPVPTRETINIGVKTTTARGSRYLRREDFEVQVANGTLKVIPGSEVRDKEGNLQKVQVEGVRYVKSAKALIEDVLGRDVGGKQNLLVMNDEAHHAYRIKREEPEPGEEETLDEEAEDFFQEATVWIEGLDRINKLRGINFCVDLSATPYFLGRVGQETNKPFPWVVSDFGLVDAIESGLVKIPQMPARDLTGAERAAYFNIWNWIMPKLTPAERGGTKGSPKPEAILKYAHHPIAILGGLWEELLQQWQASGDEPRPPVFILVCKNTRIAKVMYEWLAEGQCPVDLPAANIGGFRNCDGKINTIRVDSKVVHETDSDEAKSDETRWMRFILDTVGKTDWTLDRQARPVYPEGFEELANKLKRPLHPPGRDVRCIVSVGMLTEGWDCTTVTHIIGIRPFMSQLLCEQVVGRGLRRTNYELGPNGRFTEEVAQVFGVPFEVIPFKANPQGARKLREKRYHVHAVPQRERYEVRFPRVDGYTQAIRNRVTIPDWEKVPGRSLLPDWIPTEAEMKGLNISANGRPSLSGPGKATIADLEEFRSRHRIQELVFEFAGALTKLYVSQPSCQAPAHVLFPQVVHIVRRYVAEKVKVFPPADLKDLFLAPYYGWVMEILLEAIRPDTSQGETPEVPRYESSRGPGSTAEVNYWTSREPREIVHSHVNYLVPDTLKWEQSAGYFIDTHPAVDAFVKNAGLGFAIPYFHNGQMHDYMPDFIVRLKTTPRIHLILEAKGFDPLEEVKRHAAERWVAAVNADGTYGEWRYGLAKRPTEVNQIIANATSSMLPGSAQERQSSSSQ